MTRSMEIKIILLIEDNAGDARLLREMFAEQGTVNVEFAHVDCMGAAEKYLSAHEVDIILLDLGLPDLQGLGAIRRAHAAAPRVPLVVLTGFDDELLAEQALQEGAQDYLIKGQIEQRGLLRALRYATERKRLDRLKDEFVSTVSHELRTPLTSIAASLGLLVGNAVGQLPHAMGRLLSIAHAQRSTVWRGSLTIFSIWRRWTPDVSSLISPRVEVRALVEQVIEANRAYAEDYGVRIRFEDACIEADADVRADPNRLFQVVTNLLSNAIKFSPTDNEVVIAVVKEAGLVRLTVRDHGSGIPVDFKPLIFEKFAQADAKDARQKGGTGLGLSIVKQIVDRLSGKVGFADAPGGGTVFPFSSRAGTMWPASRSIGVRSRKRRAWCFAKTISTRRLRCEKSWAKRGLPSISPTPWTMRSGVPRPFSIVQFWSTSSYPMAMASI